VETHRPAVARHRPKTLRPRGGHIGPGLFLVADAQQNDLSERQIQRIDEFVMAD
jgi:hypothetical protein